MIEAVEVMSKRIERLEKELSEVREQIEIKNKTITNLNEKLINERELASSF